MLTWVPLEKAVQAQMREQVRRPDQGQQWSAETKTSSRGETLQRAASITMFGQGRKKRTAKSRPDEPKFNVDVFSS
jgi:hypothetical protein